MLLAQLEVVVEVARLGSLSQAAEALSLTQPAVSWRLRALESELGAQLFVRTRRGVRPTDAGRALLPHAQRSIQAAHAAARAAREHQDTGIEAFVVASIAGATLTVLPEAIRRLYRRHPGTQLTVHTAVSAKIAEMVAQEAATLGVASDIQHPEIEAVPLFDDHLVLVVAGTMGREALTARALEEQPFVVLQGPTHEQGRLRTLLREAGIKPRRFIYIDTMQAAKELVVRGAGFAFLPKSQIMADLGTGTLRRIDLGDSPLPPRRIVALRRADAGPAPSAIKTLIEDLRALGHAAVDTDPPPIRMRPRATAIGRDSSSRSQRRR